MSWEYWVLSFRGQRDALEDMKVSVGQVVLMGRERGSSRGCGLLRPVYIVLLSYGAAMHGLPVTFNDFLLGLLTHFHC